MKQLNMLIIACACMTHAAQGSVWNESVNGDLSSNNLAPTPIIFDAGINQVSGTMGSDLPQNPPDRDIFTVTLPAGWSITKIDVLTFDPAGQSFYAIAPGNSINVSDPANHLSNTLVKQPGDILPQLALSAYSGGTGLTNPMPSGTYTFWFQELSSVVTYSMAYTVVAPEPSSIGILATVGGLLVRRRFCLKR